MSAFEGTPPPQLSADVINGSPLTSTSSMHAPAKTILEASLLLFTSLFHGERTKLQDDVKHLVVHLGRVDFDLVVPASCLAT